MASAANFVAGDRITIDQGADGFGAGDPEARTIAAVNGTTITLGAPLSRTHASGRYVEGARVGTSSHDTQGSNLGWWYTEKDGAQVAQPMLYWGWRYLQILPPGAGEPLTADDIAAVCAAPGRAGRAPRHVQLGQPAARRRVRAHAALGHLLV